MMKSPADKHRSGREFAVHDWLCDAQGLLVAEPVKLLVRKIVKQQNHMGVFGLIQWSNDTEEDATWENLTDLVKRFSSYVLDP
ncbi:hypothetical protein Tco_1378041 [Tanacetum coccineum]